jgi:uncharacterized membrane-anchored protein
MKTAVGGCALIGAGIVKLVVAYLIVRDPAQKAAWLSLVLIAGSSVLVTLGVLSILRVLPPRVHLSK